jgi:hypothetical protein
MGLNPSSALGLAPTTTGRNFFVNLSPMCEGR